MIDSDDEDKFSIGLEVQITASKQLQNYKNMIKKSHREQDPLKWWKENSNVYPEVRHWQKSTLYLQ